MTSRLVPRLLGARTLLTIPEPSAAPRVVAYFSRNRARLSPVSPPWAPGFFTDEYHRRRLELSHDEWQRDVSLRLYLFRRGHENGPVIGAVSFWAVSSCAVSSCADSLANWRPRHHCKRPSTTNGTMARLKTPSFSKACS